MNCPGVSALLAVRVKRSFHDVPEPNKITTLSESEDFESASISEIFRGKHWRDFTPQLAQSHPDAIAFFSPEAFRFFLPGYLLVALQDPHALDVSLISLLGALAGPINQEERFRMLNEAQLHAVLAVLDAITPEETDPYFWDFVRAKDGVLEYLTRPGANG